MAGFLGEVSLGLGGGGYLGEVSVVGGIVPTELPIGIPVTGGSAGAVLVESAAGLLSFVVSPVAGKYLRSNGLGVPPVWSTVELPNSTAQGDLLLSTSLNTVGVLSDVAAGSYLRSAGVGANPAYSTLTLPNAATTGDLFIATSANTMGRLADVGTGQVLVSGGVGVAPSYSANPSVTTLTTAGVILGNVSAFGNPNAAGTTASAGDKLVAFQSASFRATVGMNGNGLYLQSTGGAVTDGISFYTGAAAAAVRYGLWEQRGTLRVGFTNPAAGVPAFQMDNSFANFLGRIQANVSVFAAPAAAGTTASTGDKVVAYESASFRATVGMSSGGLYLQSTGGSGVDGIQLFTGTTTAVEAARISRAGNVIIGATTEGNAAAKCLILSNSATAPTNSVDLVHLWGYDIAAGRASLAIRTEEVVNADAALVSTHSWQVQINGSTYKIPLVFVSTP